jgi:hypothetical protein
MRRGDAGSRYVHIVRIVPAVRGRRAHKMVLGLANCFYETM